MREIGVREERYAEGDGIRPTFGDGLLGLRAIKAAGGDEHTLEILAELLRPDAARRAVRDVLGGDARDVSVGDFEFGKFAEEITKSLQRIGIGHVIEDAARRKADAHAIRTPDRDASVDDFQGQAGAGGEGIAVAVGTCVAAAAEKLVEQVTVGIMNLHAVEASFLGEAGTLDIFGDDAGDLLECEGVRRHVVGHLLASPELAGGLDRGRGDGEFTVGLEGRV